MDVFALFRLYSEYNKEEVKEEIVDIFFDKSQADDYCAKLNSAKEQFAADGDLPAAMTIINKYDKGVAYLKGVAKWVVVYYSVI